MSFFSKLDNIIRPFVLFICAAVLTLALFRLGLIIWQYERIDAFGDVFIILLNGLRIDLSIVAYMLAIPALIHSFVSVSALKPYWDHFLRLWFFLCMVLLIFFECATPAFIMEYDLRPNRLFIEYLIYPNEVFSMLINGHLLSLVTSIISLAVFSYYAYQLVRNVILPINNTLEQNNNYSQPLPNRLGVALVSWSIIVVMIFAFARGTFGHRPLNPSLVYFSTDPLVNSLTLNSLYSVAFAAKQLGDESHASDVYGNLSDEKVLQIVKQSMGANEAEFTVKDIPTLRNHNASAVGKPKNLVIILQESLGAQFVSHLGGRKITPNIDALMQEGWAFNQLYATGTRSVRGIEAVITGFTPTPARSVVKLANSQHNFFTIAELLKRHGYELSLIHI